ncbi:MAG TPA: hypothetical protein VJM46_03855 [Candidatus Saccharimonadales bacterium]|nr:hypothetical protein [Candidatus Saccharimonadales bacterium]
MSFTPPIARTKRFIKKVIYGPKLPLALTGAILLTFALTVVSVAWYTLDGSSKLDLSRPGYERERSEVRTSETQKTYDTSSPINKQAIDDFLKEYDDRSKELSGYGSFEDGALDDNDIQLKSQTGGNSATE